MMLIIGKHDLDSDMVANMTVSSMLESRSKERVVDIASKLKVRLTTDKLVPFMLAHLQPRNADIQLRYCGDLAWLVSQSAEHLFRGGILNYNPDHMRATYWIIEADLLDVEMLLDNLPSSSPATHHNIYAALS
jgi:hypothetical protein